MKSLVTTGALLALLAAGCADETASLEVRVLRGGGGDPFAGATTLRARIVDPRGNVLAEEQFAVAEGSSGFSGLVPLVGEARATIEALDASEAVVARGSSRPRALDGTDLVLRVFVGVIDTFFATTDESLAQTTLADAVVGLVATPLDDGMVLLTGGARLATDGVIASISNRAYLFDPETGQYEEIQSLRQSRVGHTATMLRPAGGRRTVVLAGGITVINSQLEASTTLELYDPDTRAFTLVSTPLPEGRAFHTATLLVDGAVLYAGGMQPTPVALAGAPQWDALTAEATPTALLRFVNNPPRVEELPRRLSVGRWGHGAVRADQFGRVLLVGGRAPNGDALDSTSVFNPSDSSLLPGPTLAVPRTGVAVARLADGIVLVAGGMSDPGNPNTILGSTDLLSLADNTRSDGPALAAARAHASVTVLSDGRVLVAGGLGAGGTARADAEVLTSDGSTRITSGSMSRARAFHAATLLPGGNVLLVGGIAPGLGDVAVHATGEVYVPLPE